MHHIVVLDGYTLNPGDLNWNSLQALASVDIYDRSSATEVLDRAKDASILVVNKTPISAQTLAQLPKLKCICVSATGFNNIDIAAAKKHGIKVCNVKGYSTPSVAQHVFALLLELTNHTALYNNSVQAGEWANQADFTYTLKGIQELAGLKMGIYGLGRIGQAVAQIALAFGMQVYAHHKHPERDAMDGVTFVDLDTLFSTCHIVSLHAPLNKDNQEIVNKNLLERMPTPAYLINTGRGGLIQEQELAYCLKNNVITAAALDVLSVEPPQNDHPLIGLNNCIITPHLSWASKAARQRLLEETVLNAEAFINGVDRNLV